MIGHSVKLPFELSAQLSQTAAFMRLSNSEIIRECVNRALSDVRSDNREKIKKSLDALHIYDGKNTREQAQKNCVKGWLSSRIPFDDIVKDSPIVFEYHQDRGLLYPINFFNVEGRPKRVLGDYPPGDNRFQLTPEEAIRLFGVEKVEESFEFMSALVETGVDVG